GAPRAVQPHAPLARSLRARNCACRRRRWRRSAVWWPLNSAPRGRRVGPPGRLPTASPPRKPPPRTAGPSPPPNRSVRPATRGKALEGVRILDFTHVQSGPTCTQLLAYMGADVIKVERPGIGDITRGQLRDVKGADSLYFTMLNGNKRSITIDSKHPKGKEILE